ncbi:MAG TPA: GNAT family protein [Ferruginibacter sp.]|nr:GNAT family protein [Ferruginibacter sp.]
MVIPVDDTISLVFLEEEHAEPLFTLVDDNRDYLKEWLPWVDKMQTVENFKAYIADTKKCATEKTDFGYAILVDKKIAGRIGVHHINIMHRIGEIGYWLADGFQGRGIATKCCTALIQYGFTNLGLNRIEIKCATANIKSSAIAEKLGFKNEGTIREGELLHGKFIDLYLYSMLKSEWTK